MTGPEHYQEAERLDAAAAVTVNGGETRDRIIARAQVHATLAVAAATAMAAYGGDMPLTDSKAWDAVCGEPS